MIDSCLAIATGTSMRYSENEITTLDSKGAKFKPLNGLASPRSPYWLGSLLLAGNGSRRIQRATRRSLANARLQFLEPTSVTDAKAWTLAGTRVELCLPSVSLNVNLIAQVQPGEISNVARPVPHFRLQEDSSPVVDVPPLARPPACSPVSGRSGEAGLSV